MPDLSNRLPVIGRLAALPLVLTLVAACSGASATPTPSSPAATPGASPTPAVTAGADRRRDRPQDGRDRRDPSSRGGRRLRPDRLSREPGAELHALWRRRDRLPAEGRDLPPARRIRRRPRHPVADREARRGPDPGAPRVRPRARRPRHRAGLVLRATDRRRPEHDLHDRCRRRRQVRRRSAPSPTRPRARTPPPGRASGSSRRGSGTSIPAARSRPTPTRPIATAVSSSIVSHRPDLRRCRGPGPTSPRRRSRRSRCRTVARACRATRSRRRRSRRSGSRTSTGGLQGVVLGGPNGKSWTLTVRPLLADEPA